MKTKVSTPLGTIVLLLAFFLAILVINNAVAGI